MFGQALARVVCGTALLALGACGVVYISPDVSVGGTDLKVEVVPMTYESTAAANLTPYIPARLPLGFQPGAVQAAAAKAAIGQPRLAALPSPPTRTRPRPGFIPDNLPPIDPPRPYRIGVADVLLLSVNTTGAGLEALPGLITAQSKRQGFVVQDDGAIAIPDAGRVRVAGMLLQDAEAEIRQTLVSAGIDPSFSLEVAEFNSQRISVGGEVRQPTLVPITLKPVYLHEAISAAGGLAVSDPDVAKIQLFRAGQTYQIGMKRFLSDAGLRQVVLRDGDSIYVSSEFREEAARAAFQEQLALRQSQQAQTDFALRARQIVTQQEQNQLERLKQEREIFRERMELGAVKRDYAYVAGEVVVPRQVPLPFEQKANLADILFQERGLNINFADYSEIYVLRSPTNPEEFGSVTAYHLDAENAANLVLANAFEIHSGDVVFVSEQPITAWNRLVSQALPQLFVSAAGVASGL